MRNFYLRHVDRTKFANIPFRPDSCKDMSRASVTICNHFTTLSNDSQFWMDFDFCHFMLCRIGKYNTYFEPFSYFISSFIKHKPLIFVVHSTESIWKQSKYTNYKLTRRVTVLSPCATDIKCPSIVLVWINLSRMFVALIHSCKTSLPQIFLAEGLDFVNET